MRTGLCGLDNMRREFMQIDKQSGIPIYTQLVDLFRRRILSGEIKVGHPLPSENEIAASFEVSRGTVRKMLELLSSESLIETFPGKASVVSYRKFNFAAVDGLGNFSKAISSAGMTPSAILLEQERIDDAPSIVREKLCIEEDAPVFYFRRLRLVNGEPWSIENTYYAEPAVTLVPQIDFTASIYSQLQNLGITFGHSRDQIGAVMISSEEASLLNRDAATPALVLMRVMHQLDGRPFEYSYDLHRSDRIRFSFEHNYMSRSSLFDIKPNETGATLISLFNESE